MLEALALVAMLVTQEAWPSGDTQTAAPANELLPITLDETVAVALRNNYGVRGAYLQRIGERFAVKVARDKFKLHYNVTGTAGYVYSAGRTSIQNLPPGERVALTPHGELLLPTGTLLSVDLQEQFVRPPSTVVQPWLSSDNQPFGSALVLGVAQPLLKNFGVSVNRASVSVAELQDGVNRLSLKANLINTISSVMFAYRAFRQAHLLFALSKTVLERARGLLEINYQIINAGRMARADLVQVESEIATREVNLAVAQNRLVAAQIALLQLLSLPSDMPIAPVSEPLNDATPMTFDQARSRALENRPEYASGLLAREIAERNVVVAHNNRLWDLQLLAQYRRGGTHFNGGRGILEPYAAQSQGAFVGVTLSVPLFDIFLEQQIVNAEVSLSQARVQMAAAHNAIRSDVESALQTLELRRRILQLARHARELATKKLDNEREKLAVGRSSTFVVLRFQDDLVNAEIAEINATIDTLNAETTLQGRVGTLLDRWHVRLD